MFVTCPKHANQQRIDHQMLAILKKPWICLLFSVKLEPVTSRQNPIKYY